MDRHPGGPTTILAWAGKDASKFFNDIHKGVKTLGAEMRQNASNVMQSLGFWLGVSASSCVFPPRIDAYLRPEAFLGDLGVDENLMSDEFWHTLREARPCVRARAGWVASFWPPLRFLSCSAQARIVEIRQEVDRLLDQCTETHKARSSLPIGPWPAGSL